jgi:hypothetical protein
MGWQAAARTTTKWVPLVGMVVSASLGDQLATALGDQLIGECEAAAKELTTSLRQRASSVPAIQANAVFLGQGLDLLLPLQPQLWIDPLCCRRHVPPRYP